MVKFEYVGKNTKVQIDVILFFLYNFYKPRVS